MAYCAYLRKSRADAEAEAHGAGETLARHEAELIHLAARLNINLTKIYREVVSGETIASRPQMQKLLAEVEAGAWQGVLVVEITRLARGDTIDQGLVAQAFKYSGTKIITPTKVYDPANEFDEEYFEFGLFMSRREYKMINQRQQRGRIASSQEGKYVGNRPPYGYRRIKLTGQKGWTLEPDENAPNVQLIYNLFTKEGLGATKIAHRLNELKVPTITGKPWIDAVVREILTNPVYAGWIRWGARAVCKTAENGIIKRSRPRAASENIILAPGIHPAIITQEQFDLVQQELDAHKAPRARADRKLQNPLAGVVFCAHCGKPMTRRPGKPDMLMCFTPGCPTVGSSQNRVEDELQRVLRNWLKRYKIQIAKQQSLPMAVPLEKTLANLQKEQQQLEKQSARIYQLLEQGVYSTEEFLQRRADVGRQQDDLCQQISKVQEEIDQQAAIAEAQQIIIPRIERVLQLYPHSSVEEKNSLLKSVLTRSEYSKTTRQTRKVHTDDMKLTIQPRLPRQV